MSYSSTALTQDQQADTPLAAMPLCVGNQTLLNQAGPFFALLTARVRRARSIRRNWEGNPMLSIQSSAIGFVGLTMELTTNGRVLTFQCDLPSGNKALILVLEGSTCQLYETPRRLALVLDAFAPDTQATMRYWSAVGQLHIAFMSSALGDVTSVYAPYPECGPQVLHAVPPPHYQAQMWHSAAFLPAVELSLGDLVADGDTAWVAVQDFTLLNTPGSSTLRRREI